MRKQLLLGLCFALSGPVATAGIFKCTDAQGHVTYTNDRVSSRGCTELQEDLPVSSVPSLAPPAKKSGAGKGFPKVSPDDQRARDDAREEILGRELDSEQKALTEARKALEEQDAVRLGSERNYQRKLDRLQPYKDRVELHERNIEALRKEIKNLR